MLGLAAALQFYGYDRIDDLLFGSYLPVVLPLTTFHKVNIRHLDALDYGLGPRLLHL